MEAAEEIQDTNNTEQDGDEQIVEDEFGSFYGSNGGRIDFLDFPIDIIYELFELFTDKDLVR